MSSTTYEDDGYTFTSSNNGTKAFSNFIKFNKNNYSYKVVVYDEDDEDIQGYKTFTVGNTSSSSSSSVDGFTSSQLETVQNLYDNRDEMIEALEDRYSALEDSTRRHTMSDNFKEAMKEIIDDEDNRTYEDYNDFWDGWLERYRYTVNLRS